MLTVITPPSVEPITTAEARLQTKASSAEDSFLTLCISGARAACEGIIRRALISRVLEDTFDEFNAEGMRLTLLPVSALTSVKYINISGSLTTLDSSAYTLDSQAQQALVMPAFDTEWPETRETQNVVTVRYSAGYGAASTNVPADIRTWLLLTVGYLYAQREAFDMTGKIAAIPSRFVDSLLDPYRVWG